MHLFTYCTFAYRVLAVLPAERLYSALLCCGSCFLALSGFCFVRSALSSFRTRKPDGRVASSCRLSSSTRVAFAVAVAVSAAATA